MIEGCVYGDYYADDMTALRDRIGYDKVCFQTCTGGGSEIVIYYGTVVPGAYFEAVANNGGATGSSDDDIYNAEAYALQVEQAALEAKYNRLSEAEDAAYESGDLDAISEISRQRRDYERRGEDYKARVDDHNARFQWAF